jgi:type VI secretion system protein ImpE
MEQAPARPGRLNDEPFEWVADADPRIGPVCEAFIDGKYYWLPFERIAELTLPPPEDLIDLVWVSAELVLGNGGSKHVLVPTRYPGSEASEDDAVRTGRRTEWIGSDAAGYRGLGQREWVTDRGQTGLLEVRRLLLDAAAD